MILSATSRLNFPPRNLLSLSQLKMVRLLSWDRERVLSIFIGFNVDVNDDEHKLQKNPRTYGSKFRFEPAVERPDDADL